MRGYAYDIIIQAYLNEHANTYARMPALAAKRRIYPDGAVQRACVDRTMSRACPRAMRGRRERGGQGRNRRCTGPVGGGWGWESGNAGGWIRVVTLAGLAVAYAEACRVAGRRLTAGQQAVASRHSRAPRVSRACGLGSVCGGGGEVCTCARGSGGWQVKGEILPQGGRVGLVRPERVLVRAD
jgi:hypothetical protein